MSKLLLRFDDVTPQMAWSKFLPFKKAIEDLEIKSILGVVPNCKDKNLNVETANQDFFSLLRQYRDYGDNIFQHGTFHDYSNNSSGILGINNNSEFAGINLHDQIELLKIGKKILQNEGIWEPFFMAPSHSFDENTLMALKLLDFKAITDGYGFYPYKINNINLVPQLVSKILPFPIGIQTICIHINTMNESSICKLLEDIKKNKKRFINFNEALKIQPQSLFASQFLRWTTKKILQHKRNK